jgi:phosphatidylglycerophosphate synthase
MNPVADKLLIAVALLGLVGLDGLVAWVAISSSRASSPSADGGSRPANRAS